MSEKNKIVVIYRSKTGFTKKYAAWLSEALNCDLLEGKKVKAADLLSYDTIIYGAGIYAAHISGLKLITGNFELIKSKKIIVFAVGSSPDKEGTLQEIRKANIPEALTDKIKLFYLRGGFNYNKLSPINKILMNMIKPILKKSQSSDEDQNGLLDAFKQPQDFTDRKYLKPIIESSGI